VNPPGVSAAQLADAAVAVTFAVRFRAEGQRQGPPPDFPSLNSNPAKPSI
jgi:hypothetical protein